MFLNHYHIPVIDADIVSREVVEPGEQALLEITKVFGSDILLEDGRLNRAELGNIIFKEKEKRQMLNEIVHPAVRQRMLHKKDKLYSEGYQTIVMDIPLLFENNLTYLTDRNIVVYTIEAIQLKRLMKRNQLTEEQAKDRMKSQMDINQKKQLADAVIDNSGSIEASHQQLEVILKEWELLK
ncbi:dephospho-CoA kinase [Gracilibacillus caseinilyticus]|uniref:Dephospho-CoA kinase n=1 Tax=Gracilibacillus caseinilyticus TaxID=2932256 RepID=A0ABY4F1N9_9BACI|nr:dephospho-CoA kinase [Gracilibacillus caseinilyticus]UOQ50602.1 dephospho-CoA kinase [Gracilibacillus caseinilyticus]